MSVSVQQHHHQHTHSNSISSSESFYSLQSSPKLAAAAAPEFEAKPRTVNISPKLEAPALPTNNNNNSKKQVKSSPFTPRSHHYNSNNRNASSTTLTRSNSNATSIFERDVECSPFSSSYSNSNGSGVFSLSNISLNNLPAHRKSENFIPPALNASVEALVGNGNSLANNNTSANNNFNNIKNKQIDIIQANRRPSEVLAANFPHSSPSQSHSSANISRHHSYSYQNQNLNQYYHHRKSDVGFSPFRSNSMFSAATSNACSPAAAPTPASTSTSTSPSPKSFCRGSPVSIRRFNSLASSCMSSSPSTRKCSVAGNTGNISVEDLVRERNNKNSTVVSFYSYSDYLQEEEQEKQQQQQKVNDGDVFHHNHHLYPSSSLVKSNSCANGNGNATPVTPMNLFTESEISSRKSSISKILFSNNTSGANGQKRNLLTTSLVKRSKSVGGANANANANAIASGSASNTSTNSNDGSLYNHSNNLNIQIFDELRFKSMMTRKMSNLDNTLHEFVVASPVSPASPSSTSKRNDNNTSSTPKIPDSPTASPIVASRAFFGISGNKSSVIDSVCEDGNTNNEVNGSPTSAMSSPIRLDPMDIDVDDADINDDVVDPLDDFENVLQSAFSFNYGVENSIGNGSANGGGFIVSSLEETLKRNERELWLRR